MHKIQSKKAVNNLVQILFVEDILQQFLISFVQNPSRRDSADVAFSLLQKAKTNYDRLIPTEEEREIISSYEIQSLFGENWLNINRFIAQRSDFSFLDISEQRGIQKLIFVFQSLIFLQNYLDNNILNEDNMNVIELVILKNSESLQSVSQSLSAIFSLYTILRTLDPEIEEIKILSIESGSPIQLIIQGGSEVLNSLGKFFDEIYAHVVSGEYRKYKQAGKNIGEVLSIASKINDSCIDIEAKARLNLQLSKECEVVIKNMITPLSYIDSIETKNKMLLLEHELSLSLPNSLGTEIISDPKHTSEQDGDEDSAACKM